MSLLVEKKDKIPTEETTVLIPEARLRKRRRRLRTGFIVIMVSAIVLVALISVGGLGNHPSTHPSSSTASTRGSAAVLPVGSTINASSVVAIQMFSSTRGVAISTFWNKGFQKVEHSYLTTTDNGGISWKVGGLLPAGTWSPNSSWNPMMVFFTPQVGYIATSLPRNFLLTSNGGRTWSNVGVTGMPTALWMANGQLLATSEHCSNPSAVPYCGTTILSVIRPGSLTATSASRIPLMAPLSPSTGTTSSTFTAIVIAWHQSTGLAVENNFSPTGARLLATANSGATWHQLVNPCPPRGAPVGQAISAREWYIMCSAGVGTMHAVNSLFRTDNAGQTWTLLAHGSPLASGPNVGNIGVMFVNSFGVSSDGRYLWIDGGPGFLQFSADGGRHWQYVGSSDLGAKTNITGPYFASVGHEAWMPILFGGLARTNNGASWKVVGESSFP
jgi:hypothetical protein